MKISALYEKVGALWKCRGSMKKSVAVYENVGALWKNWDFMKMSVLYEKVSAFWKRRRPIQQDMKSIQQLYKLTILLFGLAKSTVTSLLCSCLLLVVHVQSWRCCPLHLLLLSASYRKPASLYGRTAPVLVSHGGWRSTQNKTRCPIECHWKWTVYIYEIDLAYEDMHGQF